jgi:predicted Ser/Thr protein kinase
MPYPQIVEYNEAVQHPAQAFVDSELKRGSIKETNLGLPLVLSGGFALTYTLSTSSKKYAVRCFHRETPSIEQRYDEISKKLKCLGNGYFVDFDFQRSGIKVKQDTFPIEKMDWVEGDPLGVWLDKNFDNKPALQKARTDFAMLAAYLEREGIAHGDIQNGNVMLSNGTIKLIDYDGMFVPALPKGKGSEIGHRHFQHPERTASDFGPTMDRFSFIALDLSLQAVLADKTLYKRFRDGGETIIFKANDFADPQQSEIFKLLLSEPQLKDHARNFATICEADIDDVPTLADFLAGKKIPTVRAKVGLPVVKISPRATGYIAAFPVVDALDFAAASRHVGDRVELIGKIVEVKPGVGRRGRGKGRPYIFINFGGWRANIVKISIWSEGLEKLTAKPTPSWTGRWVSITGLIDPPYTSHRYGYTHLSITVQEDGKIQWLDEAQAKFRLGSVGKTHSPRNRQIIEKVLGTAKGTIATSPKSSSVRSSTSPSTNQTIVQNTKQSAARSGSLGTGTTSAGSKAPAPQTAASAPISNVPTWVWVAGGIVALYFLFHLLGGSKPSVRLPASPSPSTQVRPSPETPFSKPRPPTSTEPVPMRPQPKQTEIPPSLRKSEPSTNTPGKDPTTANLEKSKPVPEEIPPALPPPIEVPSPNAPTGSTTMAKPSSTPQLDLNNTEDAKRVQRRLIDLGFLSGSADGIWGPLSRRALEDFRGTQKMGQGDTWDETTQQLLFGDSAVRAPVSSSYVGGWGNDLADCRQSQGGRGHLSITARRAEAFGTACEFQSVQQEGANMWRLQARCANSSERWNANIRFTIVGNQLTWSSERGTVNYVRCSG